MYIFDIYFILLRSDRSEHNLLRISIWPSNPQIAFGINAGYRVKVFLNLFLYSFFLVSIDIYMKDHSLNPL
jgi:hypothetical protein